MANLKLNPSKCNLFHHKVSYLEYIISAEGVKSDFEKVSAAENWNYLDDVLQFWSFPGLCTYYSKFMNHFSSIARPFTSWQKINKNSCGQINMRKHLRNWKGLKIFTHSCVSSAHKIIHFGYRCQQQRVGLVLKQKFDGQEHIIAYWSKCLSKPEKIYCTTKKELLSIVKAMEIISKEENSCFR